MEHRNEIDPAIAAQWDLNFAAESNNIYQIFAANQIILTKTTYELLAHNNTTHIRIYLGLDTTGASTQPKAIAVSAYLLDNIDSSGLTYADIVIEGSVYELFANVSVGIEDAKTWINNWNGYKSTELFKNAFVSAH
jgi:hypothetical protein